MGKKIKAVGYDEAIIGQAYVLRDNDSFNVFVYDAEKIRSILMERDGMDSEEARDFIGSEIEGAYVGNHTPVFVWTDDLE